jgi:5-oxoprolinase (ATP-hydrolysing)
VIKEYGLATVHEYMGHIRDNAEKSVRSLLKSIASKCGTNKLSSVDYLDDGSPVSSFWGVDQCFEGDMLQICLEVTINEVDGSAVMDFTGTGPEVRGNLNAPISVVHAAVIYCMRAMLDMDIPLNAGCLVPLEGNSIKFSRQNTYQSISYNTRRYFIEP